ncbi:hypothetical protein [Collimonas humicola]|uniref:hypothetical protein n=1 Tax=Collimonas humicola TaxID=2825886 RepID=UPI001B8D3A76|nr:hypothetical protein [Collimonas humicola]
MFIITDADDERPGWGDIVRPKGWNVDMFVLNGGIDGVFEGIYNPVLVEWTDENGSHIEVFSRIGMMIVKFADPNDPRLQRK